MAWIKTGSVNCAITQNLAYTAIKGSVDNGKKLAVH